MIVAQGSFCLNSSCKGDTVLDDKCHDLIAWLDLQARSLICSSKCWGIGWGDASIFINVSAAGVWNVNWKEFKACNSIDGPVGSLRLPGLPGLFLPPQACLIKLPNYIISNVSIKASWSFQIYWVRKKISSSRPNMRGWCWPWTFISKVYCSGTENQQLMFIVCSPRLDNIQSKWTLI